MTITPTVPTVEIMAGASRCRDFTSRGRQCGNYTRRTVVYSNGTRQANCGRHDR